MRDPAQSLDEAQHNDLIELLRTHPQLVDEVAGLEKLAREAGTGDVRTAVEAQRMLEVLCTTDDWTDPSAVLGRRVPFAQLLAVADTRLAAARSAGETESTARVSEVSTLLRVAQRQVAAQPVAECLRTLRELGVSEDCTEQTFLRVLRRDSGGLSVERQAVLERAVVERKHPSSRLTVTTD